jgi:hypothetical protein
MAVPTIAPSGNMKAADVTTDIATPISGDLAIRIDAQLADALQILERAGASHSNGD